MLWRLGRGCPHAALEKRSRLNGPRGRRGPFELV